MFGPTKLPGPLTMQAVAVCGPASIVPPSAFTVIVSTWFVPTGFVAVAGVIWMFALTNVFTASAEFGATPSVCDRERRRARNGEGRRGRVPGHGARRSST